MVDDEPAPAAPAAAGGAEGEAAAPAKSTKTAYDYSVPYNGERVPLSKFKGKAVIVCNPKSDDPEALNQMPALAYLNQKYYKDGLKIWCFTTEQVWCEVFVCVLGIGDWGAGWMATHLRWTKKERQSINHLPLHHHHDHHTQEKKQMIN